MSKTDSKGYGIKQKAEKPFQDLIATLTILKKSIGIYPDGHSAINHTSERFFQLLQDNFFDTASITIITIKNNLIINGKTLEAKNHNVKDFSQFLNRLGIASLELSRGLNSSELQRFYRLAHAIPPKNQLHQHKEIFDEIKSLSHLYVKEIDLSDIRFTDVDTINSSAPAKGPATIWNMLILGCLPPEQEQPRDSTLLDAIGTFAMTSFNRFLQDFNVPENRIATSYDAVLKNCFHTPDGQTEQFSGKQDFFRSIHRLLPELSPELKNQLLALTLENIDSLTEDETLTDLLCSMPGQMIIAVLELAKDENLEISTSFIRLLSTLSRRTGQPQDNADAPSQQIDITMDQLKEFFNKEWYEKYVSGDYAGELHTFSSEAAGALPGRAVSFPIQDHMNTLQEENINRKVVTALLNLMETEVDEQIYSDHAIIISHMVPALLKAGDYLLLGLVYRAFHRHEAYLKSQVARNALTAALKAFSEAGYYSMLAEAFAVLAGRQCRELEELIVLTCADNLPWLIDLYVEESNAERNRQIFALICQFGDYAAEETLQKLPGSSVDETIALLKLIQACGGNTSSYQVRRLLKSSHSEVRMEAIKALLKSKDPAAVTALQKLLHANSKTTVSQALNIIQEYDVQELAPDLASLLKTLFISKVILERNKAILSTLGTLGNVNVLPALKKTAFSRFSFNPQHLRQTQEFLYNTLIGYPRSSVQELVLRGLRSKNKIIRGICLNMAAAP